MPAGGQAVSWELREVVKWIGGSGAPLPRWEVAGYAAAGKTAERGERGCCCHRASEVALPFARRLLIQPLCRAMPILHSNWPSHTRMHPKGV